MGHMSPGARTPQSLDMSVAWPPRAHTPQTHKLRGRSPGAVASPDSFLLIPAFAVSFHSSVPAVGVCGLQFMGSWLAPWRRTVFLPRDLAFLLQLQAPAVYRLAASALSRPQHAAASGVGVVTAGLTLLPVLSCHTAITDITNQS